MFALFMAAACSAGLVWRWSALSLRVFAAIVLLSIVVQVWVAVDAVRSARRVRAAGLPLGQPRWTLYVAVVAVCLFANPGALIVRCFVRAFTIPSPVMQPTILPGEHLLADMGAYGVRVPFLDARFWPIGPPPPVGRGDVVVFTSPVDPATQLMMRVVGLPGELIEIRNKQVYVDGEPLSEPYAVHADPAIVPAGTRDNLPPVRIAAGNVFVMGDHRDRSFDSRFWGTVPTDLIRGRAGTIYFSWDPDRRTVRWDRVGRDVGMRVEP